MDAADLIVRQAVVDELHGGNPHADAARIARLLASTDPAAQAFRAAARTLLATGCANCQLEVRWDRDQWRHVESHLTVCNPSRIAGYALATATPKEP